MNPFFNLDDELDEAFGLPKKEEPKPVSQEGRLVDRYEDYRRASPNNRMTVQEFKDSESKPAFDNEKLQGRIDEIELSPADKFLKGLTPPTIIPEAVYVVKETSETIFTLPSYIPEGTSISIEGPMKIDYNTLPLGQKEAQEMNGVRDHGLGLFKSNGILEEFDLQTIGIPDVSEGMLVMPAGTDSTEFEIAEDKVDTGQPDLFAMEEISQIPAKIVKKERKPKSEKSVPLAIDLKIPSSEVRMIAIDQASNCGWATKHASGVWDFNTRKDESSGMKMLRFRSKLKEVCQMEEINLIVYERVAGFHKGAIIHAAKMVALMETFAEENGIEYKAVSASEVKKFATGIGNANKDKMVAAAQSKLGYTGNDDNEADALWIYQIVKRELGL